MTTIGMTAAAPIVRREGKHIAVGRGEAFVAYVLAGPGLVLLLALFVVPVLAVFVLSVTDWQFGARAISYVGLRNFTALFVDPLFRASLTNTIVYVLIVVPGTVGLGLLTALLIESGRSMCLFYRAVHLLPFMTTLAAMAMVWEALLHPTIGLVNRAFTDLGLPAANWLRDPATALPTLAVIGIWQSFGFATVLFIARLKGRPQDLYDAAEIDGADGMLDRLFTVTLPFLGPVIMFVVIVSSLLAFKAFDTVQILTQGGPDKASEMLLHTLYTESFQFLHAGYGAAITVVFLAIVLALTLLQARVMDRRVHYS
jgi:multiple sugar transport system permease protein